MRRAAPLAALSVWTAGALALASGALGPTAALLLIAALFLPYALALSVARPSRALWIALITCALAARLALCFAEPLLSDDIYRYLWDGRVQLAGHDPYRFAPLDEALGALRDASSWPRINHPAIPTIYPPGSQLLFALSAALGASATGLRLIFLALEAACFALAAWAAGPGRARQIAPAAVYLLNPLALVEGAWSGHVDVVAWSAMGAGIALIVTAGRPARAGLGGALLGAACAIKWLPALAAPLLWRHLGGWRRRAACFGAAALVVALAYAPYLGAGSSMFDGFGQYAARWSGNDGAYRAIERAARAGLSTPRDPGPVVHLGGWNETFAARGWTRAWQGREVPATSFGADQIAATLAKAAGAGLAALALLWALLVPGRLAAGFCFVLGAILFVAPTVHPWYVAWLVPLAALSGRRWPVAFSAAALAAYLGWLGARLGRGWGVPDWAVALEFSAVAVWAWWEGAGRAVEAPPHTE